MVAARDRRDRARGPRRFGGLYRLATTETGFVAGAKLRIMQPNLPQDQKFRTAAKHDIMDRYISISDRATAPDRQGVRDVTHLFWPESAFPFFLEQEADALARIANLLRGGAVLITGAARLEEPRPGSNEARVYNSIRVIGSDGAISRDLRQSASRSVRRISAVSEFSRKHRPRAADAHARRIFRRAESAPVVDSRLAAGGAAHLLRSDFSRRGDPGRAASRLDAECVERRLVRFDAGPLSALPASAAAERSKKDCRSFVQRTTAFRP